MGAHGRGDIRANEPRNAATHAVACARAEFCSTTICRASGEDAAALREVRQRQGARWIRGFWARLRRCGQDRRHEIGLRDVYRDSREKASSGLVVVKLAQCPRVGTRAWRAEKELCTPAPGSQSRRKK